MESSRSWDGFLPVTKKKHNFKMNDTGYNSEIEPKPTSICVYKAILQNSRIIFNPPQTLINFPRLTDIPRTELNPQFWSASALPRSAELSGCHATIATECSPLACLLSLDLWRWKMREMKSGTGRQQQPPYYNNIAFCSLFYLPNRTIIHIYIRPKNKNHQRVTELDTHFVSQKIPIKLCST